MGWWATVMGDATHRTFQFHGRQMRCVTGEAWQTLCVFRARSVRTPQEARRLLQQGCNGEPPGGHSMSQFEWAIRALGNRALEMEPHNRGRLILRSRCATTQRQYKRLAGYHGLSWYDGTVTQAWLGDPSAYELLRCLRLLSDTTVARLEIKMPAARIAVGASDDQFVVVARSRSHRVMQRLRLLGFRSSGTEKVTLGSLQLEDVPDRLLRLLGDGRASEDLRVVVHGRSPLWAVS